MRSASSPVAELRRAAVPLLLGVLGIALTAWAIRHTELVTGRYISSGVPPIPAFATLLFLVLLRPVLARISPRWVLDRGQIFLVYAMMTIGVALGGAYLVRAFLPHLVSVQYWSRHDPALVGLDRFLPWWYAPGDPEVIRLYFEGTYTNRVPWGAWLGPLLRWSAFFFALYLGAFSLVLLWQRRWIRSERLTFPLLYLPLTLTAPEADISAGKLFRRSLFWSGVGVAALFNGLNIAHALHPAVPAPGFQYSLRGLFPTRPWTPFNSIRLFFMLETIGFGYFIPLEVTFSTWFFYFLLRLFAVAGLARGYEIPGFPFTQEQCTGAYLAVALFLLWSGRHHLRAVLRSWAGRGGAGEQGAAREERWALMGLLLSLAFVLIWCHLSRFPLLVAVPFFAVLGCFVLVYARLRAETGMPNEFIYPYGLPKSLVVNAFSVPGLLDLGGVRTMVVFSSHAWLSRHHYGQAMAAYQLDGVKLVEAGRVPRWILILALTLAFGVGLAGAFWAHLSAYYELGSNMAAGGTGRGEYRARVALQEYQWTAHQIVLQPPRDPVRLGFTLWGFVFAAILAALRRRFPGDPFHPLGFILATAYGDTSPFVFPLFVAWLAKALILKIGGLKLYRRGIPFFVGLIVGHFFCGGVFWPVLSVLLGPETSRAYHLYFGG
ncbi:MAG TPA: hypothetical protein EYP85_11290 [Armatimonadetes bacterium]|nr:hypothetical protein [Armatimonadota bacterium]